MSTDTTSILIIEDHRDIAEMVVSYMESRGFTVDYAADGVTGLHLAVCNDYDAIVLDLMLPGMDGLDVCAKLRNEARKDTPVIMLTARDTLNDKVTGLETGADDYLDTATLKLTRNNQPLNLTPIMLKILTVLMRASPAVVTRRELERQVWGDILPDSDTLRSHLYNLRKVLDRPYNKQLLHTLQGTGYKIEDVDEKTG